MPRPSPRPAGAVRTGLLALLLAAAAAGCGSAGQAHGAPPTAGPAPAGAAADRIGPLFVNGLLGARDCTASVVHARGGNLLITAAHCVAPHGDPVEGLVFAPGYRDGRAPHGSWQVTGVTVDPRWGPGEDEEYDLAFLTVGEQDGRRIEDAVGANTLATGLGFGLEVTVTGYPNSGRDPITCRVRTTSHSATQQRFDCGGFTDGTSGSPWVTAEGQVVGVIGGYQQGGDVPEISYSVAFDGRAADLYRQAGG